MFFMVSVQGISFGNGVFDIYICLFVGLILHYVSAGSTVCIFLIVHFI
jgi:hypothetical protein